MLQAFLEHLCYMNVQFCFAKCLGTFHTIVVMISLMRIGKYVLLTIPYAKKFRAMRYNHFVFTILDAWQLDGFPTAMRVRLLVHPTRCPSRFHNWSFRMRCLEGQVWGPEQHDLRTFSNAANERFSRQFIYSNSLQENLIVLGFISVR